MTFRRLLLLVLLLPTLATAAELQDDDAFASIAALHARLRTGVTSAMLTDLYLRRIDELDPALHAVIEVNPDARMIAMSVKPGTGPLSGLPILIKDNIDTHDRMLTTASRTTARCPGSPRKPSRSPRRAAPSPTPSMSKPQARAKRLAGPEGIDAALAANHLDVLLGPSTAPACVIDPVLGDHFFGGTSRPAAVAGYPSITIPMGYGHELPLGITLFGAKWSEPTLIAISYSLERFAPPRHAPRFLPTVPAP